MADNFEPHKDLDNSSVSQDVSSKNDLSEQNINDVNENHENSIQNDAPVTPPQTPPVPRYYPASQAPQYQQPVPPQTYSQSAPQNYQQTQTPSYQQNPGNAAYRSPINQNNQQPPYPPVNSYNAPYGTPVAPNYQQPPYYTGYYPPVATPRKPSEGLAIASLILGICSLVFFWIPFFNVLIALVGLVLGIVAKVKKSGGIAVAGIIISSIGFLLGCAVIFFVFWGILREINTSEYNFDYDWDSFNAAIFLK